jgi:hypothetical protein
VAPARERATLNLTISENVAFVQADGLGVYLQ